MCCQDSTKTSLILPRLSFFFNYLISSIFFQFWPSGLLKRYWKTDSEHYRIRLLLGVKSPVLPVSELHRLRLLSFGFHISNSQFLCVLYHSNCCFMVLSCRFKALIWKGSFPYIAHWISAQVRIMLKCQNFLKGTFRPEKRLVF